MENICAECGETLELQNNTDFCCIECNKKFLEEGGRNKMSDDFTKWIVDALIKDMKKEEEE